MLDLIEKSAGEQASDEEIDRQDCVIAEKIKELKNQKAKVLKERRLLKMVRVINESKLEIQFQSEIVMTQRLH